MGLEASTLLLSQAEPSAGISSEPLWLGEPETPSCFFFHIGFRAFLQKELQHKQNSKHNRFILFAHLYISFDSAYQWFTNAVPSFSLDKSKQTQNQSTYLEIKETGAGPSSILQCINGHLRCAFWMSIPFIIVLSQERGTIIKRINCAFCTVAC